MGHRLFKIYMIMSTIRYNLKKLHKRFKPGDIVQLEGLPYRQYLIVAVDYHITKQSNVCVCEFPTLSKKIWYPDLWFYIAIPGRLTKLEKLIYFTNIPINK
jgi:hypothetical protein